MSARVRHVMLCRGLVLAILLAAFLPARLDAQPVPAEAAKPTLALPVVSFSLDFPGSIPERYKLEVGADGRSSYDSTSKISADSEDRDTFHLDFVTSAPTREKILELAERDDHFRKLVDNSSKQMARTGTKVLSYRDAQGASQGSYNYSKQPAVQQLTILFQDMALTLEFARRLRYDLRYQKLALDFELKRMEEMAQNGSLVELQAIAPILNQIAADPSVINVARARAQRLVAKGEAEAGR